VLFLLGAAPAVAGEAGPPSPREILTRSDDADPWGLAGAELTARMILRGRGGSPSQIAFTLKSHRYEGRLTKIMLRILTPSEFAGAGFLQVQNGARDDDRFLFLPEDKRVRRIAASSRGDGFLGTDFSFAELDRRDLRDGSPTARPDENVGQIPCYHLDVAKLPASAPYAHIEVWISKDNYLPLKWLLYDRSGALRKTLLAEEEQRVSGHWFITRARMVDQKDGHSTELVLDRVYPRDDIGEDEFTVRALEKF
jgi:hypothetical protein